MSVLVVGAFVLAAPSAQAAPAAGSHLLKNSQSVVTDVRWRHHRCWWRHGHRHCLWWW